MDRQEVDGAIAEVQNLEERLHSGINEIKELFSRVQSELEAERRKGEVYERTIAQLRNENRTLSHKIACYSRAIDGLKTWLGRCELPRSK